MWLAAGVVVAERSSNKRAEVPKKRSETSAADVSFRDPAMPTNRRGDCGLSHDGHNET
jgi:hypothetical protein